MGAGVHTVDLRRVYAPPLAAAEAAFGGFCGDALCHRLAVVAAASENYVDLHDVHMSEPSLENLFLHHTGRSLRP